MSIAVLGTFSILIAGFLLTGLAFAETTPAPRMVITAGEQPAALSAVVEDLSLDKRTIAIPGASWLQLQPADVARGAAC